MSLCVCAVIAQAFFSDSASHTVVMTVTVTMNVSSSCFLNSDLYMARMQRTGVVEEGRFTFLKGWRGLILSVDGGGFRLVDWCLRFCFVERGVLFVTRRTVVLKTLTPNFR